MSGGALGFMLFASQAGIAFVTLCEAVLFTFVALAACRCVYGMPKKY